MCPPLNYGTENVKRKGYKVWLASINDSTWSDALSAVSALLAGASTARFTPELESLLSDALAYFQHVGEMRADSIDIGLEKGDTVDGNNLGEIVLSKACTFSAELINATPDNINELANLGDKEALVILQEVDEFRRSWSMDAPEGEEGAYDAATTHTKSIIVIGNGNNGFNLSVSEKVTGGNITTATLTFSKSVSSMSNFRQIFDVEMNADLISYFNAFFDTIDDAWISDLAAYRTAYNVEYPTDYTDKEMFYYIMYRYKEEGGYDDAYFDGLLATDIKSGESIFTLDTAEGLLVPDLLLSLSATIDGSL
jgi:hypothetical protein